MRPSNERLLLIFFFIMSLCSLQVSAYERNPLDNVQSSFKGDGRTKLQQGKRIGIVPVILPDSMKDRTDAQIAIQNAIAQRLKSAGYEVVMPDKYQSIFDRYNHQVGGIYNPFTGALNTIDSRSVSISAKSDFILLEKLDVVARIEVVLTHSNFEDKLAYLFGVEEYADGSAPDAHHYNSRFEGTLPSLSLKLELYDPSGELLYANIAGLQLTGYIDKVHPSHGRSTDKFVPVPFSRLLHDEKRIERAAVLTCLPLQISVEEIQKTGASPVLEELHLEDLKDLPAPPAGEIPTSTHSRFGAQSDDLLKNVHRVSIIPITTDRIMVPDQVKSKLMSLVRSALKPLQWKILDGQAIQQELAALMSHAEFYDRYTGKFEKEKIHAIRQKEFDASGAGSPDAILRLEIRTRNVDHEFGDVAWDGVNQSALTLQPVDKSFFHHSSMQPVGKGSLAAMSLSVSLIDKNGEVLFESLGGIELLQRLLFDRRSGLTTRRNRKPEELFKDEKRLENAVKIALHDLEVGTEASATDAARQPDKN